MLWSMSKPSLKNETPAGRVGAWCKSPKKYTKWQFDPSWIGCSKEGLLQ